MNKQEAFDFINNLVPDEDGRIMFISHEILLDGRTNTRTVNSTPTQMIDRLTNFFDDSLCGSFRDGIPTTIISFEQYANS